MATGRIRRTARRGAIALVLGWVAVMVGSVLIAPSASADPQVTVYVRDLTPPLVSVDAKGTVTFVNQIQDKTVQVGGGGLLPSLVNAVVHTDVTLGLPSGPHTLQSQPADQPQPQPASSWQEKFTSSCLTCTITYTYRVTVPSSSVVGSLLTTVTGKAVALMPQNQVVTYNGKQLTVAIGVPTPFIVNTLIPLPNLPSVNLPSQVTVTVPGTGAGGLPTPGGATPSTGVVTTTTTTTTTSGAQGVDGEQYAYDTGAGAPKMAPADKAAATAFDPSRFAKSGSSSYGAYLAGGSGGIPGSYDGASVPVFGQLAGLDGSTLDDAASTTTRPASSSSSALPVPALIAVVALAGVVAALVRTHQANRAQKD
jgi:hypothetical protein